jgi:glutathione synthase/RimK-type ligase-like ATP-grasp enzyme
MTASVPRLLIYTTEDIRDFGDAVLHAFQRMGGDGEVRLGKEITGPDFPDHDIILVRFAAPYNSIHYRTLKDHVAEHGCLCLNKPVTMAWTSNKCMATDYASEVMKVARSGLVTRETNFANYLRGFTFPIVMKPKFSNGGKNIFFYKDLGEALTYMSDEICDHRTEAKEWQVQEAVDFVSLVRCVYMDGRLIDAVFDPATSQYHIRLKLWHKSQVWPEDNRAKLEKACAALSKRFDMPILVVDFFVKADGSLVFNEINSATNLRWLRLRSGVQHATLLANYILKSWREREGCQA